MRVVRAPRSSATAKHLRRYCDDSGRYRYRGFASTTVSAMPTFKSLEPITHYSFTSPIQFLQSIAVQSRTSKHHPKQQSFLKYRFATHRKTKRGSASKQRMRRAARGANTEKPTGHANPGLSPATTQGRIQSRHASARPRDLPCSTIARPPQRHISPRGCYTRTIHGAPGRPGIAGCVGATVGGRPRRPFRRLPWPRCRAGRRYG